MTPPGSSTPEHRPVVTRERRQEAVAETPPSRSGAPEADGALADLQGLAGNRTVASYVRRTGVDRPAEGPEASPAAAIASSALPPTAIRRPQPAVPIRRPTDPTVARRVDVTPAPAGQVQRKEITDYNEAKREFQFWIFANQPQDADKIADLIKRFEQFLAQRGDSLSAATSIMMHFADLVTSNDVVARFTTWADTNHPADGTSALQFVRNYMTAEEARDRYVTSEAQAALNNVTVIGSGQVDASYQTWFNTAYPIFVPIGDNVVKAYWTAKRALRAYPTTQAIDLLIQQRIGSKVIAAMQAANVRTGTPAYDVVQYPGVPMVNPTTQTLETHPEGYLNPTYWEPLDPINYGNGVVASPYWNFRLKQGVNPADAVRAAFAGPTRLECLSTTAAVLARGMLETLGDTDFNRLFAWRSTQDPGVVIGTGRYLASRVQAYMANPNANQESDLIPGDWIYYRNDVRYPRKHPAGLWQGENCIYEGNGLYSGFGLSNMSTNQLKQSMEANYKKDPTAADLNHANYDPSLANSKDPVVVGLDFTTVQRFRADWIRQNM